MKLLFSVVAFFVVGFSVGQAQDFKSYHWEANRSRFTLTEEEEKLPEYVLFHHAQYDYVLENNQFLMYSTMHRIARVNNAEAVQRNNRIYIPMRGALELVDIQARSISKDGKVVTTDKASLKELKDEETGDAYRIFAMEGVELGSEVEYFYIRKMAADLFNRNYMQFDVPVKSSSFLLTSPGHLEFDIKSYNGYPAVEKEKKDDRNIYSSSMKDIPALKKEEFSNYDNNRKRFDFKLAYNLAKSKARLFTWDDAAKRYYDVLSKRTKDEDKALEKFVKTLGDKAGQSEDERIKNIETRIKSSIKVNKEARGEDGSNLETIIKTRLASQEGVTRLLFGVFEKLNIACYPVITADRDAISFDAQFDTWSYLVNYLLYFPHTQNFLSPDLFEMRYPIIPANMTAMQGLFIEPVSVGGLTSALATIKDIPPTPYTLNTDNMNVMVKFNKDLSSNVVEFKRHFGGINAQYVAPYYELMPEAKKSEFVTELMKQIVPDVAVSSWTAKPVRAGLVDDFEIDVNFESGHFIEKAGPRILLKVGEMIGPQVEMYRDEQRMTDVENEYNRGYDRTIRVEIPQGYTIRNADDLNMNVRYDDNGKEPFLFESSYVVKNNELVITIKEYYKEIFAPLARYEDFRKVINAAADFNKIVLVFEKK